MSSKFRNSVSKIDTGLSNLKRLNSEKNFNSKEINRKKLNEFTMNSNSNPSKKGEKEKALKNIISNINLEESINALEKASNSNFSMDVDENLNSDLEIDNIQHTK